MDKSRWSYEGKKESKSAKLESIFMNFGVGATLLFIFFVPIILAICVAGIMLHLFGADLFWTIDILTWWAIIALVCLGFASFLNEWAE